MQWKDLSPTQRVQIRGQADSHTWPMLPKERQKELITRADKSIARKRKSGQIKTNKPTLLPPRN